MVVVKAGIFKMGSPDVEHHKDEYPPHEVSIAPVAVSQFELTFASGTPVLPTATAAATSAPSGAGISSPSSTSPGRTPSATWNGCRA